MIYKFQCTATGPVHMNQSMAELLLETIDHTTGERGVITAERMPQAITVLKALIDEANDPENSSVAHAMAEHTHPLIDMLEQARVAGKDITWGV